MNQKQLRDDTETRSVDQQQACSASFDPQTVGDWLLPFRKEDNAAWQRANLMGRIFFPAYLLMAACRTLMFWAMMLMMLPVVLIVGLSESKPATAFSGWMEHMFKAAFCKPNVQAQPLGGAAGGSNEDAIK